MSYECFGCEKFYITSDVHPYCSEECKNELEAELVAAKESAILAGILDPEGNAVLHSRSPLTPQAITKIVDGFKINLTPSTKEP